MGAACLLNASRCGRMHCYFTGPFFLAMVAASLLHGRDVVSFGGWGWLGGVLLAGGVGLTYLPERIWGKYARRATPT